MSGKDEGAFQGSNALDAWMRSYGGAAAFVFNGQLGGSFLDQSHAACCACFDKGDRESWLILFLKSPAQDTCAWLDGLFLIDEVV